MTKGRVLRTVTVGDLRRRRLWAYGYLELAKLFFVSERTVKRWVAGKKFDPGNLETVLQMAKEVRG